MVEASGRKNEVRTVDHNRFFQESKITSFLAIIKLSHEKTIDWHSPLGMQLEQMLACLMRTPQEGRKVIAWSFLIIDRFFLSKDFYDGIRRLSFS